MKQEIVNIIFTFACLYTSISILGLCLCFVKPPRITDAPDISKLSVLIAYAAIMWFAYACLS